MFSIHRLGRTGRAGKDGHGILVLSDFEQAFLNDREMRALPLKQHSGNGLRLDECRSVIYAALDGVPDEAKSQAYQVRAARVVGRARRSHSSHRPRWATTRVRCGSSR